MNTFIKHSKFVQTHLTLSQIKDLWNESDLWSKKPAKLTTIRRWLNNGPATKNVHFEPWIITVSQIIKSISTPVNVHLSIEDKIKKLLTEATLTTRETAVVTSLDTFVNIYPLSQKQLQLIDSVFDQKFG